MYIQANYDYEASALAEKLIFCCEKYELRRDDIMEWKEKGFWKYVKGDDLPQSIQCQVLIYCETPKKARIVFLNPTFIFPDEIFAEPLLNRELIGRSERNGGFGLEAEIPLNDPSVELHFCYTS